MKLPVRQENLYMGLFEVSGLLHVKESAIEVEYQSKDVGFGLFDSDVMTSRIPYQFIESIELEKKWFSWRLEINFRRFPSLGKPLKVKDNCLSFVVSKKHIKKARDFRTKTLVKLIEHPETDPNPETDSDFTTYYDEVERSFQPRNRHSEESGLKNMLRENDSLDS